MSPAESERVVIGMAPHKRSATIEVMTAEEDIVGGGRFGTDRDGYAAMLAYGRQWPGRVWAVEGCAGIGKHIANRLVADGEQVVDVPPKLSARARVFATGQGRKTDATDAHSVALVGTRMSGLRPVVNDEQLAVLRILVDRRRSLGEDHTRMVSQLHHLLAWSTISGGRRIHDLRHTAACLWLAKGVDAATVQAWTGHTSIATTNIYLHHLGTGADRAGLDRLKARGNTWGTRAGEADA